MPQPEDFLNVPLTRLHVDLILAALSAHTPEAACANLKEHLRRSLEPSPRAKMARGLPLTDADRRALLDAALNAVIALGNANGEVRDIYEYVAHTAAVLCTAALNLVRNHPEVPQRGNAVALQRLTAELLAAVPH